MGRVEGQAPIKPRPALFAFLWKGKNLEVVVPDSMAEVMGRRKVLKGSFASMK